MRKDSFPNPFPRAASGLRGRSEDPRIHAGFGVRSTVGICPTVGGGRGEPRPVHETLLRIDCSGLRYPLRVSRPRSFGVQMLSRMSVVCTAGFASMEPSRSTRTLR